MKHPEHYSWTQYRHSQYILGISLLLLPAICFALKSDHSQPIHIEADTVNVDEKNGTSQYRGNVHFRQGSMKVDADTIVITTQEKKVHLINAEGDPAHFEQLPDNETETIKASAIHIDYNASEGELLLKEKARLTQGTNEFSSDTIRYTTRESQVIATSEGSGRVRAVINPDKVQ